MRPGHNSGLESPRSTRRISVRQTKPILEMRGEALSSQANEIVIRKMEQDGMFGWDTLNPSKHSLLPSTHHASTFLSLVKDVRPRISSKTKSSHHAPSCCTNFHCAGNTVSLAQQEFRLPVKCYHRMLSRESVSFWGLCESY